MYMFGADFVKMKTSMIILHHIIILYILWAFPLKVQHGGGVPIVNHMSKSESVLNKRNNVIIQHTVQESVAIS